MAKSWRPNGSTRGMRRVAGSHIAGVRKHVYVCNTCGGSHTPEKPGFMCGLPVGATRCNGTTFDHFDSFAELKRYGELKLLLQAGRIGPITRQKKFPLMTRNPDGLDVKVGEYWSDFSYVRDGQEVIEDVKGDVLTDLAAWKVRHVEAQYGVKVEIVNR